MRANTTRTSYQRKWKVERRKNTHVIQTMRVWALGRTQSQIPRDCFCSKALHERVSTTRLSLEFKQMLPTLGRSNGQQVLLWLLSPLQHLCFRCWVTTDWAIRSHTAEGKRTLHKYNYVYSTSERNLYKLTFVYSACICMFTPQVYLFSFSKYISPLNR